MKLEKMVQIGECKIPSLKKPTPFGRPTQGQAFRDPPPSPGQKNGNIGEIGENWLKLDKLGQVDLLKSHIKFQLSWTELSSYYNRSQGLLLLL